MKRGCTIGLVALLLIGLVAAVVLYGVHRRYYGNIRFNGTVWRRLANQGGMGNPRQRMVKDLRQRYLRNGMTRQEIRQLLGKPDYGSFSKDVDSYFIGVLGFMSVDASTLDIRYDSAGRVARSKIVEH